MKTPRVPIICIVEWIEKNIVRVFFSSGRVVEVALPWVRIARQARVVDDGMGLDPGDGKDVGADTVAVLHPTRVLLSGDRGWIGSGS